MKIIQCRVVNDGVEAWLDVVKLDGPILKVDMTDEAWLEMTRRDHPDRTFRLIEVLSS